MFSSSPRPTPLLPDVKNLTLFICIQTFTLMSFTHIRSNTVGAIHIIDTYNTLTVNTRVPVYGGRGMYVCTYMFNTYYQNLCQTENVNSFL